MRKYQRGICGGCGLPVEKRTGWGYCRPCTTRKKQEQRARVAERQGRVFVPAALRRLIAALAEVDQAIAKDCSRAYRSVLAKFPHVPAPGELEQRNARFRERYGRRPEHERNRVARYKQLNPDRKSEWDFARRTRETTTADGTLTKRVMAQMKAAAHRCAYCGEQFGVDRPKQTDHVIALAMGGTHTRDNVVIACAQCNASKAKLSVQEWMARLSIKGTGSTWNQLG